MYKILNTYGTRLKEGRGRPQGSPPLIHSTPAPTMNVFSSAVVVIVRAGVVGRMGGDPCGRPGPYHLFRIILSNPILASLLLSLIKWQRDDLRRGLFAADVDRDRCAGNGMGRF